MCACVCVCVRACMCDVCVSVCGAASRLVCDKKTTLTGRFHPSSLSPLNVRAARDCNMDMRGIKECSEQTVYVLYIVQVTTVHNNEIRMAIKSEKMTQ